MTKTDWNEYPKDINGFPKEIIISREDLEDDHGDGNKMPDESWYRFHETIMDAVTNEIFNLEFREPNDNEENEEDDA